MRSEITILIGQFPANFLRTKPLDNRGIPANMEPWIIRQ